MATVAPVRFGLSPWPDANSIPPDIHGLGCWHKDTASNLTNAFVSTANRQLPAKPNQQYVEKNVSPLQDRTFNVTFAGSARSSVPGGSSSWATAASSSLIIPARLDLESSTRSLTNSSSDKKCFGWLLWTWSLNLHQGPCKLNKCHFYLKIPITNVHLNKHESNMTA